MSGHKKVTRRFSLDSSGYHQELSRMAAKSKSSMLRRSSEGRSVHSLDEPHVDFLKYNSILHKPARSTIEEETSDQPDGSAAGNSLKNQNKTFHKLFPEISETEDLLHVFNCALHKEMIYHGKMFVSHQHVCFHSSVLLKETKVVIHTSIIQTIKKKNTAKIVPNAIAVLTGDGHKYVFVSFRNRETCFKLLQSLCPQLQTEELNDSLKISFTEHSHEVDIDTVSSESSLDDITHHHRISLVEESESPDSTRTLIRTEALKSHARNTPTHSSRKEMNTTNEHNTAVSWVTMVTEKVMSVLSTNDSSSLNRLFIFYLILVLLLLLSSGYIGFRIVALEKQLSTLEASEFTVQREFKEA